MIDFTVWGTPAPKGSKSAFALKRGGVPTGRVVVTEQGSAKKTEWKARVRAVVQEIAAGGAEPLGGPLAITLRFYLPRPKSAPKRRRTWPDRMPDIDKLIRLILDAMNGALIEDDARIVQLSAMKDYAEATNDPRPRAEVLVWRLPASVEGEAS